MKHIVMLALLPVLLWACQEEKPIIESINAENLTEQQIDSVLNHFTFKYESPTYFEGSQQMLIPISTDLLEKRTSYTKDGYGSTSFPRYWNILFYHLETGEQRLLTEQKVRISRIYTGQRDLPMEMDGIKGKVLYTIADIDFNKDQKLNGNDPSFLFASNIDGTKFERVSPLNEDLASFEVIPNTQQLLIKTRRDTNQDSLFNHDDELIWYKVMLKDEKWTVQEMIDSTQREKIRKLYFEQWLKKK